MNIAVSTAPTPQTVMPLYDDSDPQTLVLQPFELNAVSNPSFQTALEQALTRANKAVIVDLLGVDTIAVEGLAVLKAGIKLATHLRKELIFLAADSETYAALEQERSHYRSLTFQARSEICCSSFSKFLSDRGCVQPSTLLDSSLLTSQPFVKADKPVSTVLPAEPYTQTGWHSPKLAS